MDHLLVCVFAKPPRGGAAKTRLARTLGADAAAAIAEGCLGDTWDAVGRLGARAVLASPQPEADHGVDAERWPQGDGDLGARLERILGRALELAPAALALGADAPGLPLEHLAAAARALATHDAVLGPADDGGYWTLGLRECPEGLLAGLPWSAPDTFASTLERLRSRGLSVALAPRWFDLDEVADLERFTREVPEVRAPRTWAALRQLGRAGAP